MTQLKLITFDLDNTLWPVDEVIRQANRTCDDWIARHHPDAAAAMTPEQVRSMLEQRLEWMGWRPVLVPLPWPPVTGGP